MLLNFLCAVLLSAQTMQTARVPILMYHSFSAGVPENEWQVSAGRLEEHLAALDQAGYVAVDLADLSDYVAGRTALPENCVVLTSDDGYAGVIEIALPLCEQYGMKLSCAVIGSAVTKRTHFDPAGCSSDILELTSHSFDLHRLTDGMSAIASAENLPELLTDDTAAMNERFGTCDPMMRRAFTYPYGVYTADSDGILRELGFEMTLTCDPGCSEITCGNPDSLFGLPRVTVTESLTGEELLHLLKTLETP